MFGRLLCVVSWGATQAEAVGFHFGAGVGLKAGTMGDPQLYFDAPSQKFHIQPQYSPAVPPPYRSKCPAHASDGWGHAVSSDLIGDFQELPVTFGPCAISKLDEYTSAGTGCTLRINQTHVGSLVNGDTTVGWEVTNNYAAVVDSSIDLLLVNWTQVSHGIEGNHSDGEKGWIGTPGNHIPPPFGLIGNVVAFHNSTSNTIVAMVSTSVGDPRKATSLPAFLLYGSKDFVSWAYLHPLYQHPVAMNRAECGDLFPIGKGSEKVTAANVDFGLAAADAHWVLMWSRPARVGGRLSRNAGVVYMIGSLVGGRFVPSTELQAAEYGNSFYASQSVLGPGAERIIMANLGSGHQSLPRAITLNDDLSLVVVVVEHKTSQAQSQPNERIVTLETKLTGICIPHFDYHVVVRFGFCSSQNFQPAKALSSHYTGAPFVFNATVKASGPSSTTIGSSSSSASGTRMGTGTGTDTDPYSTPLPFPPAMARALDLRVTVRMSGGSSNGGGGGSNKSTGRPRIVLNADSSYAQGIELTFDFNTSTPTGTSNTSMRTLHISAGNGKFATSIPVAGSLTKGATIRVVVDDEIVEIFGGATPASFLFPSAGGANSALDVDGGEGTFEFEVEAHQVAPAAISISTGVRA